MPQSNSPKFQLSVEKHDAIMKLRDVMLLTGKKFREVEPAHVTQYAEKLHVDVKRVEELCNAAEEAVNDMIMTMDLEVV